MVKGLYTAYTGMVQEQKRLDVVANNLANADTNGYKKEGVTSAAFSQVLGIKIKDSSEAYTHRPIGKMSLGVRIGESYRDWSEGSIKNTQNPYDFALSGEGFFTIGTVDKNGEEQIRYTRDGAFTLDANGVLRTKDGDYVLDENGDHITIPKDATGSILAADSTGVLSMNGETIAKLGIADFENYDYLEAIGENLFQAVDGYTLKDSTAAVEQKLLETSNVNVVNEMVNMITVTRAYETGQKMVQTVDGMLDKAVNQVGKV